MPDAYGLPSIGRTGAPGPVHLGSRFCDNGMPPEIARCLLTGRAYHPGRVDLTWSLGWLGSALRAILGRHDEPEFVVMAP